MNIRWRRCWVALGCIFFLLAAMTGCGQRASGNSTDKLEKYVESSIAKVDPWERIWSKWREEAGNGQMAEEAPPEDHKGQSETELASREEDNAETGNGVDTEERDGPKKHTADTTLSALAVQGTQLVDSQGNPVQLRGISTHGLAWFPGYVNADCFAQLKEEWGIDVIRLAMYTAEYGGYCTGGDKDGLKSLIRDGVQYATDCGLYVIIDWHILSDGNPNTYIEDAKAFFEEMSRDYADHTNVIYEICNEPNGGTSWSNVKSYAEQIIDVIRKNDEDGIILVGTPNWCQYVDQAAADPIKDRENVMYTLHFYAATHKESLRNTMVKAINAGLPIFVSEYGICDASGNGAIDQQQADKWVSLMDQYGISYVAWNLSNKSETSALLKSSCNKLSGFAAEDLSNSGKWLYGLLTGENPSQAGTSWTGGSIFGGAGNGSQSGGNTGQSSQTGAGNGTQAGRAMTDKSGLEVSAAAVNSWEQDGQYCCQYTLTITNPTDTDCSSWTIELNFNGNISLDNSWNGSYQVNGSRLTISSVDYNGVIPAGGSVSDVGFIVRGDKGLGL